MKLSVIVPCFNGAETIDVQLEALANQQWSEPWEIIVADNGSTDKSRAIVEEYMKHMPNLRIVEASAKRGVAHARNVGVRAALSDSVVLCDADDEVAPGWVEAIGTALSNHDLVCSRRDNEKLNISWRQRHRKWLPQKEGVSRSRYAPHLQFGGGWGLGFSKSLHQGIGGFDESFPELVEDIDFCFRAQLAGAKLFYVKDAVIHVRHRDSLSGAFRQAKSWGRGQVLLYKMYHTPGEEYPHAWRLYLDQWKGVLCDFRDMRSKEDLAKCVWQLGWQLGLLIGSLKHRVPPVAV